MTIRWAIYAPEDRSRLSEMILIRRDARFDNWLPGRIGDLLGLYWFCTPDSTDHWGAEQIARTWLQDRGLVP